MNTTPEQKKPKSIAYYNQSIAGWKKPGRPVPVVYKYENKIATWLNDAGWTRREIMRKLDIKATHRFAKAMQEPHLRLNMAQVGAIVEMLKDTNRTMKDVVYAICRPNPFNRRWFDEED